MEFYFYYPVSCLVTLTKEYLLFIMPRIRDYSDEPWYRRAAWWFFYKFMWSGEELRTMQVIFWALVLGALGGVIATLYGYGLSGVIKLVWDVIPGLIVDYGKWRSP